jgi:hypothetical protein
MAWWIVLAVLFAFFVWAGWVLGKRGDPHPGEREYRQDHNYYGGGGSGG